MHCIAQPSVDPVGTLHATSCGFSTGPSLASLLLVSAHVLASITMMTTCTYIFMRNGGGRGSKIQNSEMLRPQQS